MSLRAVLLGALVTLSCVPRFSDSPGPDGGMGPIDTAGDPTSQSDRTPLDTRPFGRDAIPPACGNGVVDAGERCDDGNAQGGDGCSSDCHAIDPDFACATPGQPCIYQVRCGDGKLGGNERCDPPNVGNGCSAECQLETGFVCEAPLPSAASNQPARCRRTVCGDGSREGSEACDDSNTVDGDGCGSACSLEPDCANGSCASKCGDGAKLPPEDCDDGNTKDGDGCSADCHMETGFKCIDMPTPPANGLNLRVIYRDFISLPAGTKAKHPDFEQFVGEGITPNLVKGTTAADGTPDWGGRCTRAGDTVECPYGQQMTTAANFAQWFHDVTDVNLRIESVLMLRREANGSYRYDSGNRGFYPIDNRGWVAPPARELNGQASALLNDGQTHNFGFTTEIRYFFQYRGGESLTFSGDDDVWIFINRRLALDLGGLHTRIEKELALDTAATALGLARGGLYEISLFHAERRTDGSNFKLTLTGIAPTATTCRSQCGDGAKASTEQCDDGNTVDGDGCSSLCRFEATIIE